MPDRLAQDGSVPTHPTPDDPVGPARVLALAYGFFAFAAGARSAVQLSVHPHRSLLAYLLSAVAAVIYLGAAILLVVAERSKGHRGQVVRVVIRRLCLIELSGVMVVGVVSLVLPAWFPDATVWSRFGSGYGYVPAVLPLLALCWLRREKIYPAGTLALESARQHRNVIVLLDEGDKNG